MGTVKKVTILAVTVGFLLALAAQFLAARASSWVENTKFKDEPVSTLCPLFEGEGRKGVFSNTRYSLRRKNRVK